MNKQKLSRYLLIASILTVVSILIVIIQSSYIKLMGPGDKINVNQLLSPLNPKLSTDVIDELEKRKEYPLNDVQVFPTPIPTDTLENEVVYE